MSIIIVQPDLINIDVLFSYLVKVTLVYTLLYGKSHVLQGPRTSRPCITGFPVPVLSVVVLPSSDHVEIFLQTITVQFRSRKKEFKIIKVSTVQYNNTVKYNSTVQ